MNTQPGRGTTLQRLDKLSSSVYTWHLADLLREEQKAFPDTSPGICLWRDLHCSGKKNKAKNPIKYNYPAAKGASKGSYVTNRER